VFVCVSSCFTKMWFQVIEYCLENRDLCTVLYLTKYTLSLKFVPAQVCGSIITFGVSAKNVQLSHPDSSSCASTKTDSPSNR
jgi:hypothetical protein